jgi:hypothetical protein
MLYSSGLNILFRPNPMLERVSGDGGYQNNIDFMPPQVHPLRCDKYKLIAAWK